MCRTHLLHTGIICPLCNNELYDVVQENLKYQRIILSDLTPVTVCYSCLIDAKKHLCKTENCKAMHEKGKDYCSAHDEKSIIIWEKPKLIENFDDNE